MRSLLLPLATLAAGTLVLSVACGENKAEQANRAVLAPIAQRNQALNQELSEWARGAGQRSDTWKNAFDKYTRLIADKEEVRKDLRSVVPTRKFSCLTDVMFRSIDRDIQMLQSLDSYTRQLFKASLATDRAKNMHEQGMASTYGYETYFRFAKEAREEAAEAFIQVKSFKQSANAAARGSVATSDTVRAIVEGLQLLPSVTRVSYPVLTDSGPDSFAEGSNTLVTPSCPKE